jgi:hypothetical protein
MALALLLALFPVQDDFTKWIAQLESESLVERDEAMRRLHALGMTAVPRIEKARDAARTPELTARLEALLNSIQRSAELAKVLGPTRRVTIASRGRPFKEILAELRSPGVSEIRAEGIDEESRHDLQIRDATWWEAMDRVAQAVGARYEIEGQDDGQYHIVFSPGKERKWPVVYAAQFRISAPEAARSELRLSGETRKAALVMVEVRHQPDLKPQGRWSGHDLAFESVIDAKGADAKAEDPGWAISSSFDCALSVSSPLWVRADAAMPLTIVGKARITFPSRIKDVALDFAGDSSQTRIGPALVKVAAVTWLREAARVKIRAEAKDLPEIEERIAESGADIVDAKGKKYPGRVRSLQGSDEYIIWEFEFTSGIENPRKITFKWVEEFHHVEIPFRLEGVRVPDFK